MGETTTTMTESHPRASAASSTGMRPGATSCAGRSGGFGRRSWEWDCAAESWLNRGGCTYGTRTTRSYCARAVVCRPCRVPCRGRCNRCAPQRRRACCGRATILHDIQVARQSLIVGGGGLFLGWWPPLRSFHSYLFHELHSQDFSEHGPRSHQTHTPAHSSQR